MKKVLLIAYHFPPIRVSSGIQRTLSLTRYLGEHDWLPSVLTIAPRAYERTSNDQLKDVPEHVSVKRAAGWDTARHFSISGRYLGFMALPDRWVSWAFGAVISGLLLIRKDKPDVIWSTYPVATAHIIGVILHRLTNIPWVADCRDSMTEDNYPRNPTQRKIYLWIERQIVTRASKVIFTTEGTRQMYINRYPDADPNQFAVVTNGYDEDIFVEAEKQLPNKSTENTKVTLVHSGILYPSERDPTAFFDALAELKTTNKIQSSSLHIILRATSHDDLFKEMLRERSIEDLVSLEPSVSYSEALQEMLRVDGLLLFQAANCNHQIPAKLYEYFRAQKPVFALTDEHGNTAETIREAGINNIVNLKDQQEIKQGLLDFIQQIEEGREKTAELEVTASYSRQALTSKFAKVFDDVIQK